MNLKFGTENKQGNKLYKTGSNVCTHVRKITKKNNFKNHRERERERERKRE